MKNLTFFLFLMLLFSFCEDKVKEFSGFTQKEMEYLLGSDEFKVWERISILEDGEEVLPNECGTSNFLIFLQGSIGQPKPLLYSYDPVRCDSADFCNQYPNFCQSDTVLCELDPEFCSTLGDGVLYIGNWFVKEPFVKNDRSDTLIFEINNMQESIFVTSITSQNTSFQYKNRGGDNGETITELYRFVPQTGE